MLEENSAPFQTRNAELCRIWDPKIFLIPETAYNQSQMSEGAFLTKNHSMNGHASKHEYPK